MSRAPKRNRPVLPFENPAQSKMDDAPSVIGLREPVEPFDRAKVLLKSRCAEPGVYLSQVVPAKLCLRRHAPREETPAQRPVGEHGDVLVTGIGEDVLFDGSFKQVVGRLHRLHGCNLAEGLDLRGTEIADADYPNLAGALQIGHRRRGFLDWHPGIGPVHLIDIDDVGAQTSQ
jgi:hypothetical protein